MSDATPGNPFRKVFSHQKLNIPARAWNTLMDMAERFNGSNGGNSGFGAGPADRGQPDNLVWVENDSGADVDSYSVLGVSGICISASDNQEEFQAQPCLTGVTPTVANHKGLFVVTYEPIASGNIGRAYVYGAFPAKIYMNSASDKFADVKDSDATQLNSGSSGAAQILWVASGTGTQWGYVRVGGSSTAVIAFTISANSTGAGYYTGSEMTRPTTLPDGTADLVTSQFGSGASDLLIANLSEAGGKSNTGHDLTATTNTDHFAISGIGLYMGTNAAGKRVVLTDKQFVGCS